MTKGTSRTPRGRANPKGGPRTHGRLQRAIDVVVRREIEAVLAETSGNVRHSARVLGISQPGMYKRLAALSIDPNKYRK